MNKGVKEVYKSVLFTFLKKKTTMTIGSHLCGLFEVVKFIDTESRGMVIARLEARGKECSRLMMMEFQFTNMKAFGENICTTVGIYAILLSCSLKKYYDVLYS